MSGMLFIYFSKPNLKCICYIYYETVYRKHYPPALGDEVWRLEKIAKDGAFHRKLSDAKIYRVQDFLKLLAVEPHSLRTVWLN